MKFTSRNYLFFYYFISNLMHFHSKRNELRWAHVPRTWLGLHSKSISYKCIAIAIFNVNRVFRLFPVEMSINLSLEWKKKSKCLERKKTDFLTIQAIVEKTHFRMCSVLIKCNKMRWNWNFVNSMGITDFWPDSFELIVSHMREQVRQARIKQLWTESKKRTKLSKAKGW